MPHREARRERLRARTWIVIAGVVGGGLAGCAGQPPITPGGAPTNLAPYEGVFTGEFVDGKPLYRLPTIEVVGARSRSERGI